MSDCVTAEGDATWQESVALASAQTLDISFSQLIADTTFYFCVQVETLDGVKSPCSTSIAPVETTADTIAQSQVGANTVATEVKLSSSS